MANLSNINNKFLVTTGGNVLIGQTAAVGSSILQVTGNSTFAGDVITNGFLKLQSQASPQIFMTSNTAGAPTWTMIARNDGYFLLGRSGVSNDFYFDPSGNATFA